MGKEIEMFNVLTVAREYGSGGADIGRKVAELLGWVPGQADYRAGRCAGEGRFHLGRGGRRTTLWVYA
jgi:hypothetical protein